MLPNPQKTKNWVTFAGENLNGKLHFFLAVNVTHREHVPSNKTQVLKWNLVGWYVKSSIYNKQV